MTHLVGVALVATHWYHYAWRKHEVACRKHVALTNKGLVHTAIVSCSTGFGSTASTSTVIPRTMSTDRVL